MSEPLRHIKTTENYTNANTNIRGWRIVFKVTSSAYDFSNFDELDINREDYDFFEEEIFEGNTFIDLCRVKGKYKRFHPDFVQCYYFSLFKNTPFPCNIFVFVEEIAMNNGNFVHAPKQITVAAIEARRLNGKGKGRTRSGKENEYVLPDYEIFYLDSPTLNTDAGSVNDLFLSMTSRFMRASPMQRGINMFKHNAFNAFTDGRGMEFLRFKGFLGIVPKLPGATTLVPLVLLVGRALGYKHCLRNINKLLVYQLGKKLRNSHKLIRSGKRHIKDLTLLLYSVEYFLTQSYLMSCISFRNRMAQDLLNHLVVALDIPREQAAVKNQLEPLTQMLEQLRASEMVKGQASTRLAVLALGFIIMFSVVAMSVILGIEPMLRVLNDFGFLPESFKP